MWVLPTDMVDNTVSLRDDPNRPKIDTRTAPILIGRGVGAENLIRLRIVVHCLDL